MERKKERSYNRANYRAMLDDYLGFTAKKEYKKYLKKMSAKRSLNKKAKNYTNQHRALDIGYSRHND